MTNPVDDEAFSIAQQNQILGEAAARQAVAYDQYREALLSRGLPPALNPYRQVPRPR